MNSTKETWRLMIRRCTDPKHASYADYGGRGITVCDRWLASYPAFLADMGPRPAGMTIERKDNSGHYEPSNCVWASRVQRANNKRNTRYVAWNGEQVPLGMLCRRLRVSYNLVRQRLDNGWSINDAVLLPAQERPWEASPIMDRRLPERPATDIELAGYCPSTKTDYFAIIHPDGTIIYHYGPDSWCRA